MTKLIIFDFDGTIANSMELGRQLANSLSKYFNYEPLENIEDVRKESAAKYILSRIKWYYLPFWAYMMRKRLKLHAEKVPLYDGIRDLLIQFEAKADLAIVGGGPVEYHEKILLKNNCNVFKFKIGNNGIKKHKAIRKFLKMGYSKNNIILIGDDPKDISAANYCNISSIAVSWGASSREIMEQSEYDFIADSIKELELYLNEFLK